MEVDPQALGTAAQRLDAVADLLHGTLITHLSGLQFDADAGVRGAVEQLVADVARWQQAARDTAAALRACAERFLDLDARATEALR